MPALAISLLGAPSVALPHGSTARGLGAAKGLALLAYLTLEPGSHSREELATLLWGDSSDAAARASLRQALKRLRAVVGEALHVDRTHVELRGPVECDVAAFLAAAAAGSPRAAEFDVSRFLAGFSLRHAPSFEEWAAAMRRRLLQRYTEVLRELARAAFARSHWTESVTLADRWLQCDPCSEEAARLGIEALYLAGDRGGALARFAEFRTRLAREVEAEPGVALQQLARRIEREADGGGGWGRPVDAEEVASDPDLEARLVGREAPWRSLTQAWAALSRRAGRVVLIDGDAGVGKTRLAEEFLRWASLEGATILRGHAYDTQTGMPYGPVVEALRDGLEAPGAAATAPEWLTEVTRLVPELRRRYPALREPPAPADAAERWRLLEGVTQLLLALAAERPTLMLIDDLQWCDQETCALLHFLARRCEGVPLALVVTLNLGELERDAPAARLCRALRTRPSAVAISLAPLGEEEVWQMIRQLGHLQAPGAGRRLAHRLHEVSDGNPFHVIELLKALFAQGMLEADPATGEWRAPPAKDASSSPGVVLPGSVRVVLLERVGRLAYELRDLLATIAVAGRDTSSDLLSHVHGMSRLRVAALADALVDRRLLVEERGAYRCAHPVIADVVRESLTPARRRELHRAIALALVTVVASADPREVAGDIARHAEHGGEPTVAYRYALVASEAATARYAFEEALSWLDLASSTAGSLAETTEAGRRTADVLRLAGWSQPPPPRVGRRRPSAGNGIERPDVDLRTASERPPP
ncbi:MAG: hypothetical protein AUH42_00980 [Gemmatimonadetes bacterium 13_1_40CM_70_11]|nr:MAG: hypothetical protein AUH42_00980 [Gemmatimonadetes bacterium 13_1_40CM_70_11]